MTAFGGAIFGGRGTVAAAASPAMDRCLRNRGAHAAIHVPQDAVALGLRGNDPRAADRIAAVPLVCASTLRNRAELAAAVGRPGDDGLTDAELLWHLYCSFGARGFARVNGQFALALLDTATDSLVLAVDCWASRPLAFTVVGDGCAFATEYRALLALPQVRGLPDPAAVACLQATKYLPPEATLCRDIHSLAPGTYVCFTGSTWKSASYDPIELNPDEGLSEDEHSDKLQTVLLSACERMVSGSDRIGVALSGGLDSTLTVGAIRKVAPQLPIYTFTAGFHRSDPAFERAAETARSFGTIHEELVIPVADLGQRLTHLVWTMEDPVAREEMLVYHAVARAAARQVPLIAYGHFSDLLFAGMPRHLLIRGISQAPFLRRALTDLYDYSQAGAEPQSLFGALLVRLYYRRRLLPAPRVIGASAAPPIPRLAIGNDEPLNSLLFATLQRPSDVGALERLNAHAGVGYGSLFQDLEVARCAFRIPERFKIRGRRRKHILRRAAEGFLPRSLAARPKDFVRVPRNDRLQTALSAIAAELLSPAAVAARGLYDYDEIAQVAAMGRTGNIPDDRLYHVWTLLLTELWMRLFIDNRGAPPPGVAVPMADESDSPRFVTHADPSAAAPSCDATIR